MITDQNRKYLVLKPDQFVIPEKIYVSSYDHDRATRAKYFPVANTTPQHSIQRQHSTASVRNQYLDEYDAPPALPERGPPSSTSMPIQVPVIKHSLPPSSMIPAPRGGVGPAAPPYPGMQNSRISWSMSQQDDLPPQPPPRRRTSGSSLYNTSTASVSAASAKNGKMPEEKLMQVHHEATDTAVKVRVVKKLIAYYYHSPISSTTTQLFLLASNVTQLTLCGCTQLAAAAEAKSSRASANEWERERKRDAGVVLNTR